MSCNGCRVLRKGCSESCVLRHCLGGIEGAEAQGHATLFLAKFFGRAGLMGFVTAVDESQRPALFQSLLFEACGRTINPVFGCAGLLWTGQWHLCESAVDTVLRGGSIHPNANANANATATAGAGAGANPGATGSVTPGAAAAPPQSSALPSAGVTLPSSGSVVMVPTPASAPATSGTTSGTTAVAGAGASSPPLPVAGAAGMANHRLGISASPLPALPGATAASAGSSMVPFGMHPSHVQQLQQQQQQQQQQHLQQQQQQQQQQMMHLQHMYAAQSMYQPASAAMYQQTMGNVAMGSAAAATAAAMDMMQPAAAMAYWPSAAPGPPPFPGLAAPPGATAPGLAPGMIGAAVAPPAPGMMHGMTMAGMQPVVCGQVAGMGQSPYMAAGQPGGSAAEAAAAAAAAYQRALYQQHYAQPAHAHAAAQSAQQQQHQQQQSQQQDANAQQSQDQQQHQQSEQAQAQEQEQANCAGVSPALGARAFCPPTTTAADPRSAGSCAGARLTSRGAAAPGGGGPGGAGLSAKSPAHMGFGGGAWAASYGGIGAGAGGGGGAAMLNGPTPVGGMWEAAGGSSAFAIPIPAAFQPQPFAKAGLLAPPRLSGSTVCQAQSPSGCLSPVTSGTSGTKTSRSPEETSPCGSPPLVAPVARRPKLVHSPISAAARFVPRAAGVSLPRTDFAPGVGLGGEWVSMGSPSAADVLDGPPPMAACSAAASDDSRSSKRQQQQQQQQQQEHQEQQQQQKEERSGGLLQLL